MPLLCSPWHYKPAQGWTLSLRSCSLMIWPCRLTLLQPPLAHSLALHEGSAPLPTSPAPCPAPQARPASWTQTSQGDINQGHPVTFPFSSLPLLQSAASGCLEQLLPLKKSQVYPIQLAGVYLAQGSQPAGRISLPPPPTPTSALRGVGQRFSRFPASSPLHPCLIAYFWAIMSDGENLFLSRADPWTVSNL